MLSRNKTFSISILLSLGLSVGNITAANAIYMGEDATKDILVASTSAGCSPAPIDKYILVLAQHCAITVGKTYINYPGSTQNESGYAKVVAQFSPTKDYLNNRENDITVIVVDKPMPVSDKLKIALKEDVSRFIANDSAVYFYGYGLIGKDIFTKTPNRAVFKFVKNPPSYMNGHPGYTEFYAVNGISEVCSGDSGGPSYVFENDTIFYLGATVASNKPFCSAQTNEGPLVRNTMLYEHLGLVDQAREWLLQNPIKSDILVESSKPVEVKETTTVVIAPTPSVTTIAKPVVKKVIAKKKTVKKKK